MTVAAGKGEDRRLGKRFGILFSCLKKADTQTGTAQTVSATRRYDAFGNVVTSTGIWNGPIGYRSGAEIPPNPEHRGEGNESRLVGRNRDAGGADIISLSFAELNFWAKYEDEKVSGGLYLGNTNLGAGLSFAGGLVSITIGGRF